MIIVNENYQIIQNNIIFENIINNYINKYDIILELNPKYGNNSCLINNKIKYKKRHIVIELNRYLFNILDYNRLKNNCKFIIYKGFLKNEYNILFNCCDNDLSSYDLDSDNNIDYLNINNIQKKYKLKFNVLVTNSIIFLELFFDKNPNVYKQFNKIILLIDDNTNIDNIKNLLINNNFELINDYIFNQKYNKKHFYFIISFSIIFSISLLSLIIYNNYI